MKRKKERNVKKSLLKFKNRKMRNFKKKKKNGTLKKFEIFFLFSITLVPTFVTPRQKTFTPEQLLSICLPNRAIRIQPPVKILNPWRRVR